MNNIAYYEIQADDTERARNFYSHVFGWKFIKEDFTPIDYWRIESDGIFGGLLGRPANTPPDHSGTNAYVCSVMVEDFDSTAEAIMAHGGRLAMEKFAIPGRCWQGYFLDPENNTFGIFQVDESAQ